MDSSSRSDDAQTHWQAPRTEYRRMGHTDSNNLSPISIIMEGNAHRKSWRVTAPI